MNIDNLIRDLDTLGVRDEIQNFSYKPTYIFSSKEDPAARAAEDNFTREKEYAAALKWNDINEVKIVKVSIKSRLSNSSTLITIARKDFMRVMEMWIEFSNGHTLMIAIPNASTQCVVYTTPLEDNKPAQYAEYKTMHSMHLRMTGIEFLTKFAQEQWGLFGSNSLGGPPLEIPISYPSITDYNTI